MNFTKEQINLYTAIASVVLLVIFFALPAATVSFMGYSAGSASMVNMLSGGGFLFTIGAILALVCPIYLLLDAFKENDALKSLKPIFVINRKLAGILLAVGAVLVLIGVLVTEFVSPGWGLWLYVIVAACVCYLGFIYKD